MSGKIFTGISNVTLEEFNSFRSELNQFIISLGAYAFQPVGSIGHVPVSGDIDYAVTYHAGRDVLYHELLKRGNEVAKFGNDLLSLKFKPTNLNKYVQVDLFIGDVNYLQWSRAGSKTPGVKSWARALLLNEIALAQATHDSEHDRERLSIDYAVGLFNVKQTKKGKTGILLSWKTLSKTLLTKDPDQLTKLIIGDEFTMYNTLSFETTLDALCKSKRLTHATKISVLMTTIDSIKNMSKSVKTNDIVMTYLLKQYISQLESSIAFDESGEEVTQT